MNILDERDVRTIHRKLKKKEYDELITLSTERDEWVRLLDEGMVVRADGTPDFYIEKGTLQSYYDAIPDDYEGSINLGHMSFASFPILLGAWTKKDLRLVDIGSGRMALDVRLHLDDENLLVKELRRAKYDLAVSAEFSYEADEQASDKYGLLFINKLFIWDFAIVGEPGNVNSSGINLKGEGMDIKKVMSLLGEKTTLSEINDLLDQSLEETSEEKELEVKTEGETSEEETEEETKEEETKEESVEEEKSEEITLSAVMGAINSLTERIQALETDKEQLKAENAKLEEKLSAKEQAEADFVEKFKKLSVSLSTEREEPIETNEASFTDGFGG